MLSHPIVSILIPCYNAEQWIAEAIESALNQTYPHKEVIVVDDGSTDGSLEIIKTFSDRIRWETGLNRGGNAARNRLLELSTGEWLQYLDADDYLLPDKVEKQIQFLGEVADADVIYSPVIVEYHQDNHSWQKVDQIPEPPPHDPWILLARWHLPQTGGSLWRKEAIVDVGGWNEHQNCCQENELYLRLLMAEKHFKYFDTPGAVYRAWSELTVCRKDPSETYRRRLEIKDKIEQYLEARNELSQLRQDAINQARFECARLIWLFNPKWANVIIEEITSRYNYFEIVNPNISNNYIFIYRLFGFSFAERLAQFKRNMKTISFKKINLFLIN
ncbi:glycosyltransferase [Coleofasciculus chthonoplastes]|uniref:glycosyltransferase n=1 Tax=Coleofasciculus chthonoplastes TaxID=64178 RepID=UPI0032FD9823